MTTSSGTEIRTSETTRGWQWADAFTLLYFGLYFVYLWVFIDFENEVKHWLTLVLLPLIGLWLAYRLNGVHLTRRELFGKVGLRRGQLTRGLGWAVLIGLGMGSLQLGLSRNSGAIWEIIKTGEISYALPLAFLFMLFTAGFTEEFFFRGVVQTSLMRLTGSRFWANVIAATLFGVYHLPYAYLLETWPSHGDLGAAISEGVLFSAIAGFIIGLAYDRFRNLLVPVVIHALFNAVWASTQIGNMIKFN